VIASLFFRSLFAACSVSSSPARNGLSAAQDVDDSLTHLSLTPLNMSPLLLPASSGNKTSASDQRRISSTWETPHAVELVRKPGDSLGISIVGGLLCNLSVSQSKLICMAPLCHNESGARFTENLKIILRQFLHLRSS